MPSLDELADSLKLLSDKTRLNILALLMEKERCVCDIVDLLETTQPNVSQHLRKLKSGGLIREERRRQWIYYSLAVEDKPYLQEILSQLPSMKEQIQGSLLQSCD